MKKTLRFVLAFGVMATLVFGPTLAVHAANAGSSGSKTSSQGSKTSGGDGIVNPLKGNATLAEFLKSLLKLVFLLGTMIAVFFIIYAGFKYVLAQGDPGKLKEAHAMLLWSVIGAAILLGAQTIADVIYNTVKQLGA